MRLETTKSTRAQKRSKSVKKEGPVNPFEPGSGGDQHDDDFKASDEKPDKIKDLRTLAKTITVGKVITQGKTQTSS